MVQFTVKHEQNIDCGGGYVKLFPGSLDQKDMHGDSEYNIMFGEGDPQPVLISVQWAQTGPFILRKLIFATIESTWMMRIFVLKGQLKGLTI